tara:strand:+ start:293 stop:1270 length:978 start_codon:yes stop_codon:yes gene_type:complete
MKVPILTTIAIIFLDISLAKAMMDGNEEGETSTSSKTQGIQQTTGQKDILEIISDELDEDIFKSLDPKTLTPGLYKSDDMEKILSFPLSSFGEEDMVIFDMDQTLITQLSPYTQVPLLCERLMAQPPHIREEFEAYSFSSSPFALMDERIPDFIKGLQRQKVKCIANTLMFSILPFAESIDVPLLRVRSLQDLGIDFSGTFSHLPSWDFNALEVDSALRPPPAFKEGIILSSNLPKHVTTLELLKNLSFSPRRVVFIDDRFEHAQGMYEGLTAKGIETYSFVYSKAHNTTSLDYFTTDLAASRLIEIEDFLKRLLKLENVDEVFK